jgi:hypothetical protein
MSTVPQLSSVCTTLMQWQNLTSLATVSWHFSSTHAFQEKAK